MIGPASNQSNGSVNGLSVEGGDESKLRQGGRMSLSVRALSLVSGAGVLALLLIARQLQPAAEGMGTHQQLGLPPCSIRLVWSIPCPSCGMTTSWSLLTRGQLHEAGQANIGGFILAIIALAYLPASCYFCLVGRPTRNNWFSWALALALLAALLASIVQWLFRLL